MIFRIGPGIRPLGELPLLVLPERFDADEGQRDRPRGVFGLRRDEPQRAANALEGLNDFEPGFVQVDILPAQAEQFPGQAVRMYDLMAAGGEGTPVNNELRQPDR